jgi:hypothetical protein
MKLRLTVFTLCLMLTTNAAQATPMSFSLASPLLTTQSGLTVTFTGTITETGGTTTFLNGDSFTIAAPLIADDTLFFLNTPLVFAPLQSVTAPLFTISVPAGTASGLYPGSFSLLGGGTPATLTVLASQGFAVDVAGTGTPVPGPATLSLLMLGIGAACVLRSRRRRA